jgi:methionyl-tRNA synthetase
MVEKYCDGVVPGASDATVLAADAGDLAAYHAAMDGSRGFLLHDALGALWMIVFRANAFVQERQPWSLSKDPAQREALEAVLGTLVRQLVTVAVGIAPFMPVKAEELWAQLGGTASPHASAASTPFAALQSVDPSGWRVSRSAGLFPRPEPRAVDA